MFSEAVSADIIAMRPGPVAGSYPQKRVQKESSNVPEVIFRAAALLRPEGCRDLRRIAEKVNCYGSGLVRLSDCELQGMVSGLRQSLCRRGLEEELCLRGFALVRELSKRTLGIRHYDTQVMAAWVLLQGMAAEMATGEGKTLAATLAAGIAALAGIPVHVITVNEYLVQRDAGLMAPLYSALGLDTGHVTESMTMQERKAAYACNITYCTCKQVAFDYLRDRLVTGPEGDSLRLQLEPAYCNSSRIEQFLLRGLCFAIIDEADSVLIDEARTPLILTRNADASHEDAAIRHAFEIAGRLRQGEDFIIDDSGRQVLLTASGQKRLPSVAATECPDHVSLPIDAARCDEMVRMALHAIHILERDRDYIVSDSKVLIIDQNTGRAMPDRSWEHGLHQLVEAKEGCPMTGAREQLGRLTYQQFFRRYMRLSGMTGTATEVRGELMSVYGLRVRKIPLHRPCRRLRMPVRIYPSADEKWAAVTESIRQMYSTGRPVLAGTGSVADSEHLSRMLDRQGIPHRVLNARQDRDEAETVAMAGRFRQVTVATNMAGRGTDIKITDEVTGLGGLHVIVACCNEARRIDRQLYGRCARQGDPGSYEIILSLDDELVGRCSSGKLIRVMKQYAAADGPLCQFFNRMLVRKAQRRMERRHRIMRKALVKQEGESMRLLGFSGELE